MLMLMLLMLLLEQRTCLSRHQPVVRNWRTSTQGHTALTILIEEDAAWSRRVVLAVHIARPWHVAGSTSMPSSDAHGPGLSSHAVSCS